MSWTDLERLEERQRLGHFPGGVAGPDREGQRYPRVYSEVYGRGDPLAHCLSLEGKDESRGFKRWRLDSMEARLYEVIWKHIDSYDVSWRRPLRPMLFRAVAESLEEDTPDLADSMNTTQLRNAINEVRKFLHSKQLWVRR